MIGFLKRIFGRKRKMKKFDIVKEVLNADGSSRQVMENGVIAFNRKQLVEMYDSCGERIINILKISWKHEVYRVLIKMSDGRISLKIS